MKKIFTICAAIVAAMSLSAQEATPMTCAEAATKAAELPGTDGKGTLDDTNSILAAITGYITKTNGTVSKQQQTFYIDDDKSNTGAETIQAYWANLPQENKDNQDAPLVVGDKVTITGRLFNYNGSIPEIKNADVVVLEHAVVKYDTTEVSVCDAIEIGESLNAGEVSDDYFEVTGVVTMAKEFNTTYNNQTFDFKCADNDKILEGYNVTIVEGDEVALGDSVKVLGRLTNYNDTKIEFNGGKAWVLSKGDVKVDTIRCFVDWAAATALALPNGAQSQSVYVITGYVDSIATAYSEQYNNISFFMCDDMENPKYEFEAFRVKGGADIQVGDKVVVTAYIQHYHKDATETDPAIDLAETVAGGTYVFAMEEGLYNTNAAVQTVKTIENGQIVIIREGVRYNAVGAKL